MIKIFYKTIMDQTIFCRDKWHLPCFADTL